MKLLIVTFCAVLSCALAAPQFNEFDDFNQSLTETSQTRQTSQSSEAPGIVSYTYENNGAEGYRFAYELTDGQIRIEEGSYKDSSDDQGNPVKVLVVIGSYSHVAPDGETYWVNYQADEGGYKPKVGKGVGGAKPGDAASIDPNLLKSLVG